LALTVIFDILRFIDKPLLFDYNIQMNQLPCLNTELITLPSCILMREAAND